ncbi:MAG: outer membrane protein assembly factor BamD [Termitinemataceae bacterium]|nr:MAG: outer membrane protein assembly factor BamD [Termitinemataceae bacterium]
MKEMHHLQLASKHRLEKLFLLVPVFIFFCCGTVTPTKKDKPDINQNSQQNVKGAGDDSRRLTGGQSMPNGTDAQIILTAEETTKKLDALIDVELPEPDYNNMFDEPAAEIAEQDDVNLPDAPQDSSVVDTTPLEQVIDADESPPVSIKESPSKPQQTEITKPSPPPPVPAFVRPPQPPPPVSKKPAPAQNVASDQSAASVLTARNPVTEIVPPEKTEISRTVKAVVGQYVEVPYIGNQWVFLGEQNGKPGLAYDSRHFDDEGQNFLFRAEKPGIFLLKFYKQDYLRDYYINDFVQVEVVPIDDSSAERGTFAPPQDQVKVTALPRWPMFVATALNSADTSPANSSALAVAVQPQQLVGDSANQGSQSTASNTQTTSTQTASVQTAEPTPNAPVSAAQMQPNAMQATVDNSGDSADSGFSTTKGNTSATIGNRPEGFLELARTAYKAGQYQKALELLETYKQYYPAASDEALWILGQCFEANSPERDIRSSLDSYTTLIREYPQSKYYNDSEKRIAFLNKFYFNIR